MPFSIQNEHHDPMTVLIVEDEVLIADTISRYLTQDGHEVVGIAADYTEAVHLYDAHTPDMTLLDIRLKGSRTGIEVAEYIRQHSEARPYIFLTSQIDRQSIDRAKATLPSGYLTKPIQKHSLYSTIAVAHYQYVQARAATPSIQVTAEGVVHRVVLSDILYVQAQHVYVALYLRGVHKPLLLRLTLYEVEGMLPPTEFVQVHRSFIVQLRHVTGWNNTQLYLDTHMIPLSRSRRKSILEQLESMHD